MVQDAPSARPKAAGRRPARFRAPPCRWPAAGPHGPRARGWSGAVACRTPAGRASRRHPRYPAGGRLCRVRAAGGRRHHYPRGLLEPRARRCCMGRRGGRVDPSSDRVQTMRTEFGRPNSICGRPPRRKVFCSALIRSLASICPASHEGWRRQAISWRNSPKSQCRGMASISSKAELSFSQGLPCKPHIRRDYVPTTVPHSGRESSRRAAPLFRTARVHQAGQRRRPLGSVGPSCRAAQAQLLAWLRTRAS